MGATKCILIIDDEDDIREVAQIGLEIVANWQVITASSGDEGVAKAKAQQPDAILLDVMMPDMDGPTTFRKLQEDLTTQSIPVLFLTAKAPSAAQRQFADLGVQGVIAKPFDPLKLSEEMIRLLGWES